ncbi:MAG: hypothetical protein IKW33_01625 [Clostridia bacterium]|nr:hypothetical protein [Clostridia bacterium]
MKGKGKKTSEDKLKSALIKKAIGFDSTEVTEEYAIDDNGEIKLTKKKVTKKNVPPDMTAIKILIDDAVPISEMTDEQLENEKIRLLQLLKEQTDLGGI